ncbi:MAG: membrane protein insertion efficiency factor YidD [Dethiobacter sp.]|jgi:putative membrane protein insertion efficiency factor|nr:MAG: membrane protein insertion efficiency factor YidD [Dethiobacter sp.]
MKNIILLIIIVYRNVFSPMLTPRCRFYPSCSQYCYDAVKQYGVIKGIFLGFRRMMRCHPLNPGGYDPLPLPQEE